MKAITQSDLLEFLKTIRTSEIVTVSIRTDPKMRVTDNPYAGKVVKIGRMNGVLNANYQTAVNRQRDREGKETDFTSKPRQWGNRLPQTPLVVHNQIYYLEMKVTRNLETTYQHVSTEEEIPEETLRPWLPVKKSQHEQQGVDEGSAIILRDIKLENIYSLKIRGDTYVVIA